MNNLQAEKRLLNTQEVMDLLGIRSDRTLKRYEDRKFITAYKQGTRKYYDLAEIQENFLINLDKGI